MVQADLVQTPNIKLFFPTSTRRYIDLMEETPELPSVMFEELANSGINYRAWEFLVVKKGAAKAFYHATIGQKPTVVRSF